jgi:hypothetical protein
MLAEMPLCRTFFLALRATRGQDALLLLEVSSTDLAPRGNIPAGTQAVEREGIDERAN